MKNAKTNSKPLSPIAAAGLIVVIAAIAVFVLLPKSGPTFVPDNGNSDGPLASIPRFTSEADIIIAFKDAQANQNGNEYVADGIMRGGAVGAPTPTMAESGKAGNGDSSSSNGSNYSTTNNQVEGVDEADIVKTDGEFIYTFYKNKIVITRAAPASEMEVVHTLFLDDVNPQEMFVQDGKLVLIGNRYVSGSNTYMTKMAYPIWGGYWGYSRTVVQEYDLADKTTPVKEKELEFPGSYVSSRLIGGHVYVALTTYPEYRILSGEDTGTSIIPPYKEDGVEKPLAAATQIGYLPPIDAQSFITLASLDLSTHDVQKETMVGRADQVYASQDNMYLAAAQYNYYFRGGVMPMGIAVDSVEPSVGSATPTSGSDQPAIEPIIQEPVDNTTQTRIYKFHLDNGNISFTGRGKVPGRVLNQFSMDEFDDHFRIATTTDAQYGNNGNITAEQSNNVYVLDSKMKTVGKLEDLAPKEQIYSARFMGGRAYLVTFRQVDPLFVIDLSDPANPHVLGKLKIPGYSNYLHPIDATHIIGIGKDAEASKQGDFAYYLGMKMAIFDVSDVENPIQMHSIVIGDRGTDSPALYDHKAFLFDKEKELLVIPIDYHEILEKKNGTKPAMDWPEYGESTFQGAFVYRVNLADGFVEKGRITHISPEVELKSGYYWDYRFQVQRALYIGDVLYTVSQKIIKANKLSDLSEIKSVDLVNTPKDFSITARTEGSFCAGPCGHSEIRLNKQKLILDTSSGGENPIINHSEQPAYSAYDDIVETLDWDAFKSLDETLGCPGCADGSVETITITKGNETKTVRMEAGMQVEKIQAFLDAINGYIGIYGGGGIDYAMDGAMESGSTGSGSVSVGTAVAPPATEPMPE